MQYNLQDRVILIHEDQAAGVIDYTRTINGRTIYGVKLDDGRTLDMGRDEIVPADPEKAHELGEEIATHAFDLVDEALEIATALQAISGRDEDRFVVERLTNARREAKAAVMNLALRWKGRT